VVTAALAALARARGEAVAVIKPAQTGARPGEAGDLDEVRRLTGVTDLHELARFPDPLSPEAAALAAATAPADLRRAADYIGGLSATRDRVLIEGAGGLLVRYDNSGTTIADLATALGAPVLVVIAAGLGTLNHTALTIEALATRRLRSAGVVIGCWPREPGLAERTNLPTLETITGQPVAGALPAGAPSLTREAFLAVARDALSPALGGTFNPPAFSNNMAATSMSS
jgi:dethiobiotin synthetase